ncbi:MAG: integral rane sensor signal transduction histidine kinase [Burkholderiales bacterium]|jgi:hypothetical protein|nr:integral rane sensor signal transduction histidine kinase [Burkholderiales bacterium]
MARTNSLIENKFIHHTYLHTNKIKKNQEQPNVFTGGQLSDALIGSLAKKTIHNIKSPLLVLQNCKDKLRAFTEVDETLINDLSTSIEHIKDILVNLLSVSHKPAFQMLKDTDKPRYLLFKPLLNEIISQKNIEWQGKCKIKYIDSINDDNTWIFAHKISVITSISNLLNNSYEALKPDTEGEVKLYLSKFENDIVLGLKDNGHGIKKNILNKVINGYTTKSNGHGIGLSSAIKYFREIGGNLDIILSNRNGTELNITIPTITPPKWLPRNIKLGSYIVILDNAISVHSYLQSVFSRIPNVKYFTKISEFKQWAAENNKILNNVTYFIENQLDEGEESGIDLIKSYNIISTAYITTNESCNQILQSTAASQDIKIIPKSLLKSIFTV